ncbi:MAG: hypothetical protein L0Z68_06890 [Gammaproteobacteria bacterium]|nr:hypothetical protein [Gammaproteobacteria bacterium]
MKMLKLAFFVTVFALTSITVSSCASVTARPSASGNRGHGPPPHAPAHGYRYKHQDGVELVFDSGRGVYVAVGIPNCYYFDGRYYRARADQWETSVKIDGPWEVVAEASLPVGLKTSPSGKDKTKNHPGRGHGA